MWDRGRRAASCVRRRRGGGGGGPLARSCAPGAAARAQRSQRLRAPQGARQVPIGAAGIEAGAGVACARRGTIARGAAAMFRACSSASAAEPAPESPVGESELAWAELAEAFACASVESGVARTGAGCTVAEIAFGPWPHRAESPDVDDESQAVDAGGYGDASTTTEDFTRRKRALKAFAATTGRRPPSAFDLGALAYEHPSAAEVDTVSESLKGGKAHRKGRGKRASEEGEGPHSRLVEAAVAAWQNHERLADMRAREAGEEAPALHLRTHEPVAIPRGAEVVPLLKRVGKCPLDSFEVEDMQLVDEVFGENGGIVIGSQGHGVSGAVLATEAGGSFRTMVLVENVR